MRASTTRKDLTQIEKARKQFFVYYRENEALDPVNAGAKTPVWEAVDLYRIEILKPKQVAKM